MNNFFNNSVPNNVSTRVSKALRLSIWEMYAGPNKSEIKCMMCQHSVMNRTQTKQWESGHIVAEKYHTKKPTRYDLIPICPSCNIQCSDTCIFDFLFAIERYKSLECVIRAIYTAFVEQYPDRFEDEFNSEAYRVFEHLYGSSHKYKAGGGIQNSRNLYNFIKQIQCKDEWEKIEKYSKKIRKSNEIISQCCKRLKLSKNIEFI